MNIFCRMHKYLQKGVLVTVLIFLSACQEKLPAQAASLLDKSDIQVIQPASVESLQAYFQALDYNWESLQQGIPPFILEQFPNDLDDSLSTKQRKETFFMSLLPMVLLANQAIHEERTTLLRLIDTHRRNHELSAEEKDWIRQLTRSYGLRGDPLTDHRTRTILLRRVDTLPPSLVLAQAANESAWGTSRFAREGNNLFGQWTFTPGTGIVPRNRPAGATYEVRRFENLDASVRGYFRNLNTHSAYRELRQTRQELREKGRPVTGKALARGLKRYSTRGEEYVQEIRAMIEHNGLAEVNRVVLGRDIPAVTEAVGPGGAGLLSSRYHITRRQLTVAEKPTID